MGDEEKLTDGVAIRVVVVQGAVRVEPEIQAGIARFPPVASIWIVGNISAAGCGIVQPKHSGCGRALLCGLDEAETIAISDSTLNIACGEMGMRKVSGCSSAITSLVQEVRASRQ